MHGENRWGNVYDMTVLKHVALGNLRAPSEDKCGRSVIARVER
jgi:hypothetical protein